MGSPFYGFGHCKVLVSCYSPLIKHHLWFTFKTFICKNSWYINNHLLKSCLFEILANLGISALKSKWRKWAELNIFQVHVNHIKDTFVNQECTSLNWSSLEVITSFPLIYKECLQWNYGIQHFSLNSFFLILIIFTFATLAFFISNFDYEI